MLDNSCKKIYLQFSQFYRNVRGVMDSMSDTSFCDLGLILEVADVDYEHFYFNNKKKLIFTTFSRLSFSTVHLRIYLSTENMIVPIFFSKTISFLERKIFCFPKICCLKRSTQNRFFAPEKLLNIIKLLLDNN